MGLETIRAVPTKGIAPDTLPPGTDVSARTALLLVLVAATAVVAPFPFLGQPSGHDFIFHISSWLDVAHQWREGVAYPRWAEWANWGFGEPRFIFYPPASWLVGAALVSALPAGLAPGALTWLALVLAGASMWKLARDWLPGRQAAAAAIFFTINPYHLVIVYYRSDFAELLASALFPLLVWGSLRVIREGWHGAAALAAVSACIWLSNAPAAVIATYSLALLLGVGCLLRRSLQPAMVGATAAAGGLALAAFYVLPAAWEQRWVQIKEILATNLRPEQNFLFTHGSDPEFVLFNLKVSSVACGIMLITSLAAIFAARRRKDNPDMWWMMASLGGVSIFFMSRVSFPLWRYLPELRFLQFPWRWLVPLGMVFAIFSAAAVNELRRQRVWWLALLIVIAGLGAAIVYDAWWDTEDVPNLIEAIASGHGYEGTDEYAPLGCNHYLLPNGGPLSGDEPGPPNPRIARLDPASWKIVPASGIRLHEESWSAERKVFTAESPDAAMLAIRLINYPAWEVQVDGQETQPGSLPKTAQMIVPVPAGSHRVEITFRQTWDRVAGWILSALSGILLFAVRVLGGGKRPSP
jgi:uncharacterized membrane protein